MMMVDDFNFDHVVQLAARKNHVMAANAKRGILETVLQRQLWNSLRHHLAVSQLPILPAPAAAEKPTLIPAARVLVTLSSDDARLPRHDDKLVAVVSEEATMSDAPLPHPPHPSVCAPEAEQPSEGEQSAAESMALAYFEFGLKRHHRECEDQPSSAPAKRASVGHGALDEKENLDLTALSAPSPSPSSSALPGPSCDSLRNDCSWSAPSRASMDTTEPASLSTAPASISAPPLAGGPEDSTGANAAPALAASETSVLPTVMSWASSSSSELCTYSDTCAYSACHALFGGRTITGIPLQELLACS